MKTQFAHPLATWKLSPTEVESPLWQASIIRGAQFVRARSSTQARLFAAERLKLAIPPVPGALASPWLDAQLVACSRVDLFTDVGRLGVIGVADLASTQTLAVGPQAR